MHKLDTTDQCSPLSLLQMHTLLLVQERGSCSMKELATSQKIVPATMTALVNRLVKKGVLLRVTDTADRRITRVKLSAEGEAVLQEFYEEKQRSAQFLLGTLEEEEQHMFVQLLKKIDSHLLTILDKNV